jgi:hypothetical protein
MTVLICEMLASTKFDGTGFTGGLSAIQTLRGWPNANTVRYVSAAILILQRGTALSGQDLLRSIT